MYDSLVKVKKDLKSKIIENDVLIDKIKWLENENHDLNILVEHLLSHNKVCWVWNFEGQKSWVVKSYTKFHKQQK